MEQANPARPRIRFPALPAPPNVVVIAPVTTRIHIHQKFKKTPVVLTCPYCKVTTKTKIKITKPFSLFFFCCTPEIITHECGNCGNYLSTGDA